MRTGWTVCWRIVGIVLTASFLSAAPQQAPNSTLSEKDLLNLIKSGTSSAALIEIVQKFGISFQPDQPFLDRLRKEGAPEKLIASLRERHPAGDPEIPSANPGDDTRKALQAVRLVKRGELKAYEKDFQGALSEFAQAEEIMPKWDEVYYQRGLVLADLHRYDEAAAQWKQYLKTAGPEADWQSVEHQIEQWEVLAKSDESTQHLLEKGKEYLANFDAGDAIAPLQKVEKSDPTLDNILLLAKAYWMQQDYGSLSKVAGHALAIDPNSAQATLYQGAAELGEGKIDDALATIRHGITLDSNSAFGYALECDALRLKHDPRSAWQRCDKALRLDPNLGYAHDRVGWILMSERDPAGALTELRKAVKAEPKNADWQADLAHGLLFYAGDIKDASAAALEALRLNPKSPLAHDAMGLVLDAQGNHEQAVLEFNEAIRLAPVGHPEFAEHLNKAMHRERSAR